MDQQTAHPAGWCRWCGREIYPGEEVWWMDGGALHEDCVGEYARAMWPHWATGAEGCGTEKGWF